MSASKKLSMADLNASFLKYHFVTKKQAKTFKAFFKHWKSPKFTKKFIFLCFYSYSRLYKFEEG